MTRLLTRHDPHRLHAVNGLLALLSFLYRGVLFARHGTSFPTWEPRGLALATLAVHGLLHLSSFVPPVPPRRVLGKPMIWPEFRVHSAIFALRHVLATAAWLLARWSRGGAWAPVAAGALVHGASALASWATARWGSRETRTTNSMAYPPRAGAAAVARTKGFYARAQFAATGMVCSGSPTLAFWPLLAIELAPLMMTLVRKGKASPLAYHRVYSLALWWPYVAATCVALARVRATSIAEPELFAFTLVPAVILPRVVATARRRLRAPKHVGLSALTVAGAAAYSLDLLTPRTDLMILACGLGAVPLIPLYDVAWMCAAAPNKSEPATVTSVVG